MAVDNRIAVTSLSYFTIRVVTFAFSVIVLTVVYAFWSQSVPTHQDVAPALSKFTVGGRGAKVQK